MWLKSNVFLLHVTYEAKTARVTFCTIGTFVAIGTFIAIGTFVAIGTFGYFFNDLQVLNGSVDKNVVFSCKITKRLKRQNT